MTDRYNQPDEGTLDWHVPLNENFGKLETEATIKDTEANRTNYTAHDGATFLSTDTGVVYDGDGSNWNKVARVYDSVTAESDLLIPVYSDDSNVSNGTFYFNDSDEKYKYKDTGGEVEEATFPDNAETISSTWTFESTIRHNETDTSAQSEVFLLQETGTNRWSVYHNVHDDDSVAFHEHVNSQDVIQLLTGGNVNVPNGELSEQGERVLTDSTGSGYSIDKNGTDGSGIINFKT